MALCADTMKPEHRNMNVRLWSNHPTPIIQGSCSICTGFPLSILSLGSPRIPQSVWWIQMKINKHWTEKADSINFLHSIHLTCYIDHWDKSCFHGSHKQNHGEGHIWVDHLHCIRSWELIKRNAPLWSATQDDSTMRKIFKGEPSKWWYSESTSLQGDQCNHIESMHTRWCEFCSRLSNKKSMKRYQLFWDKDHHVPLRFYMDIICQFRSEMFVNIEVTSWLKTSFSSGDNE